jgi:hypothetical protein
MGKQPSPSPEELEFIFKCFRKNLSDKEVIEELQDKTFPPRKIRFIRDRRKEYDAAKKLLQDKVQKPDNTLITARRKEHWDSLADIAKALYENIDFITERQSKGDKWDIFQYSVYGRSGVGQGVNKEKLVSIIKYPIDMMITSPGASEIGYFLSHLETEIPEVKSKGIWKAIEENPVEFFDTIKLLADKRTFRGTCAICKDW